MKRVSPVLTTQRHIGAMTYQETYDVRSTSRLKKSLLDISTNLMQCISPVLITQRHIGAMTYQ